jgi:hypothetical protein
VSIAACDHADEITPRSYVSLLVTDTLALRDQIAQQLLSGKAISNAGPLTLRPFEPELVVMPVDFGWVTAGGAIVTYSKKYGVTVVQEPTVSSGSVRWSCVVHPADAKPNVCGDR